AALFLVPAVEVADRIEPLRALGEVGPLVGRRHGDGLRRGAAAEPRGGGEEQREPRAGRCGGAMSPDRSGDGGHRVLEERGAYHTLPCTGPETWDSTRPSLGQYEVELHVVAGERHFLLIEDERGVVLDLHLHGAGLRGLRHGEAAALRGHGAV